MTTTAVARAAERSWTHRGVAITWWVVLVLALAVAGYALAYVILGDRMYPPDLADSFRSRPWGIYTHVLFGSLAIGLGSLQFRRALLLRRRRLHRTLGKIYLVSAMLTGVAGLYMAAYSFGGWITHAGFGLLAVALLTSTTTAYRAIKRRDVAVHRRWMLRSYALIFAAVTLRIELPLLISYFDDFLAAYRVVAWLCWVPNLLAIELYLRRARVGILPAPESA